MKLLPKTKKELETNVIYCADNLEVMKQLPPKSIHLIYIDPPFGTNSLRKSKTWDEQVQGLSFYDSAGGGIKTYVSFMADRLEQMWRILKPNGILCVHLDWRSVHYIKCKLDEIFGYKNFLNDITWKRTKGSKSSTKRFSNDYDSILIFKKGSGPHTFNVQYEPPNEKQRKTYKFSGKNPETGKIEKYSSQNLGGPKRGGGYFYDFEGYKTPKRGWLYPINTMNELKKGGYLIYPKKGKEGILRQKWFISRYHGRKMGNIWTDIGCLQDEEESEEYPTQKPIDLLERVIKTFSNKSEVVADFFCGCGTTLSAAQKLGRQWLGVDANPEASKTIRKRMAKDHSMTVDITPLKNLKKSEVLKLPPLEFEKYCVRCAGGVPNEKQVGDGGIDGKLIRDGTPIQVKKSHKVGRPVIDAFHKHFKRNGRGIIIALSFSKCAKEEVHGLKVDEGKDLKLITLDILLKKGTGAAA